jgi:hypothetical protein
VQEERSYKKHSSSTFVNGIPQRQRQPPRTPVPVRRGGRRTRAMARTVGVDGVGNKHKVVNADDIPAAKSEVNLWTDESPFLVNLYNYIAMRFITCPGFCLICDRDLDITTYKLPVCGRAECVR